MLFCSVIFSVVHSIGTDYVVLDTVIRLGDGHSIPTDIAQVIKKLDFNNGDDDDNFVFNCAASEAGTLNNKYSGIESFSIKLGEATMEDIGLQPAAVCR